MTARSFWIIVLKIIGIYLLLQSVLNLVSNFSWVLSIFNNNEYENNTSEVFVLSIIITVSITVLVYLILMYCCLFKPDWIIDKLKLVKSLEEEKFELNLDSSSLFKVAVIVIGGYLFVDNFPILIRVLLIYFQRQDLYKSIIDNPQTGYIIIYLFKTLIGYFMLTDSALVVRFLDKRQTN